MYTILIYPGGRQTEALVLSATDGCLRLAVPGRPDIVELRQVEGRWISESGTAVELGALVSLGAARGGMQRASRAQSS